MKYKYQQLIDELGLIDCPGNINEIEIEAYRWSHAPIEHELNFLPNLLYYKAANKPVRALEKKDMCGYCNLSFFTTFETAEKKLAELRKGLEKKHQNLLNLYTHIAAGKINKEDGRATTTKNDHFGFFESAECDLKLRFRLIKEVR